MGQSDPSATVTRLRNMRLRATTLRALGAANLLRVGLYRLGLKSGLHPVLRITAPIARGPFFGPAKPASDAAIAPKNWHQTGLLFAHHPFDVSETPPDWHANPFHPTARADDRRPWHKIGDFNADLGDIKTVWELSRFDWLVTMAARAAKGDQAELSRLNHWLQDWADRNPPYLGANWKCGQEAAIRVMHLCLAARIMGQDTAPNGGLQDLVRLHLARIAPTMGYAIGQANNHGTSEAAALFIGGLFLGGPQGAAWAQTGRRWLENRAMTLVMEDGSFSQYSTIYHRVMLDTYALAETWRRAFRAPDFSPLLHARLQKAVQWLYTLTCEGSGDAPNIGANDGARLLPLTDCAYRDFRPSVQLAAALFAASRAYEPGPWDQPLHWLQIARPTAKLAPPHSQSFDAGGLHALLKGAARAYLRYPRFRFRPSQADALHLDFWLGPENILRDAGSYSYATPEGAVLAGTASHTTICFDGDDQMPKLGRFLFGQWLVTTGLRLTELRSKSLRASAGYQDCKGRMHQRNLELHSDHLTISDAIDGRFAEAVLRFRLAPGAWVVSGQSLSRGKLRLTFSSDRALDLRLTEGQESRHYLSMTSLPVLEIRLDGPGHVITVVQF